MERKLASVQRIAEIIPHPNADRLDIVKVLGWQVGGMVRNRFPFTNSGKI